LETADPREEPEDRICGGGAAFEIKSKRADPHRRRNDEKADHDQRKNVLNDTGHNSLLSLYVRIMFYFCSGVNGRHAAYGPVEVGGFRDGEEAGERPPTLSAAARPCRCRA
jgi:hypothetical protein